MVEHDFALEMSADAARLRLMLDRSKAAELAAVLDWYREMGADEAVGETPIDWLRRGDVAPGNGFPPLLSPLPAARRQSLPRAPLLGRRLAPEASPPPARRASRDRLRRRPPTPRQFPATAPDVAVMAARTAAREAATLDELGARLAAFDGCSLKATAKNLCFYRGSRRRG